MGERFLGEINLAANLDELGQIAAGLQPQRNAPDGFQIGRDVIAGRAVTARRANGENAFLVTEIDRHAIHFWFDHPFEFFAGQQFLHALDKLPDLGLRISIVEAHHGREVLRSFELAQGLAADALAGRLGRG